MKVGDLVRLYASRRRNGWFSGKVALVTGLEDGLINILVDGRRVTGLHITQINEVISESR